MTVDVSLYDPLLPEGKGDDAVVVPENSQNFRLGRMLLLFSVAEKEGRNIQSIDRLGYYEFFSDNPFLVTEGDRPIDSKDRMSLEIAGFSPIQLAYASSGQRFSSRRRRLQSDLARLVSLGLATVGESGYVATEPGLELAENLRTVYADSYRVSAEVVLRRLAGKSNRQLESDSQRWLGGSWLLIDLLDGVEDTEIPASDEEDGRSSETLRSDEQAETNGEEKTGGDS